MTRRITAAVFAALALALTVAPATANANPGPGNSDKCAPGQHDQNNTKGPHDTPACDK